VNHARSSSEEKCPALAAPPTRHARRDRHTRRRSAAAARRRTHRRATAPASKIILLGVLRRHVLGPAGSPRRDRPLGRPGGCIDGTPRSGPRRPYGRSPGRRRRRQSGTTFPGVVQHPSGCARSHETTTTGVTHEPL
jgi:hypothetical protein